MKIIICYKLDRLGKPIIGETGKPISWELGWAKVTAVKVVASKQLEGCGFGSSL